MPAVRRAARICFLLFMVDFLSVMLIEVVLGWMELYSAAKHVQHRIRKTMDSWNTGGRVLSGKTGVVLVSLVTSPWTDRF